MNSSTTPALNKAQKKHLQALAHHLKPVIWVGQKGLSDAVYAEIEQALDHHELVKMKIKVGDRDARGAAIESICDRCGATLINSIGATATLYRANRKKPVIPLPR